MLFFVKKQTNMWTKNKVEKEGRAYALSALLTTFVVSHNWSPQSQSVDELGLGLEGDGWGGGGI